MAWATKGHVWNKLKKEMDGNYDYTKRKIPEDARCDICNEAPREGKNKWFIVLYKNRLIVRCKKCKKDRLDLIKSEFREQLA